MGIPTGLAMFALPEVQSALDTLKKAGEKAMEIIKYTTKYTAAANKQASQCNLGGVTQAPFDTLGDFLRGTKGLMLDMYRRPDKVQKACRAAPLL